MTPIIIANWKMHFTLTEANAICNKLSTNPQSNLIIAPPTPYLAHLASNFPDLNFSAQNLCGFLEEGAYTGEYSGLMLKSCRINHAIIGHSERRAMFGETDTIISTKVNASFKSGITPIICIGEPALVRQNGNYAEFLIAQLKASLPTTVTQGDMIIAYEPIWSIGTDQLPTKPQLIETFEVINSFISQSKVAKNVRLLYGGSVNSDNIGLLLDLNHVSGVLVGKSSLDPEMLIKMLERLY